MSSDNFLLNKQIFKRYLNIIRFYFFFKKKLFSRAIASLPIKCKNLVAHQQYAFYRLGMYRTLANEEPVTNDWRSLFAIIVSHAALGDREKVIAYLNNPVIIETLHSKKNILSKDLLKFMPHEAISLISSRNSPGLRLAVSIARNDFLKAKVDLDFIGENTDFFINEPDIYLLRSNFLRYLPLDQLKSLNFYFNSYNLSLVKLRDSNFPISVNNLSLLKINSLIQDGPLVSILMTAYNSASHIFSAIKSLLGQAYTNIEVVVIDDASQDETGELVCSLQQSDKRVRYVRLPVNVGTYAAKTIGLKIAKGDFVTCHDSDDWAHPEKIALQMQPLLEDKKIVFTTSQMIRVSDEGYFYARQIYPLTRLNSSSVLFRKQVVLDRCGVWDLVRTGADSEFLARLKIVFGSNSMRRINKPLALCAHRSDSLMTQAGTGYDENRIPEMRLDYWENFSSWHINCLREGENPRLSNDILRPRVFSSPKENLVSQEALKNCIEYLNISRML